MLNPKILIIDDEESIRNSLSYFFEKKGYIVESVSSGSEAIEKIKKNKFDAALIDIILPDYDGIDLLKIFKKQFPNLICIIITAYSTIQSAITSIKEAADGYFVKPPILEDVLIKVEEALEKQKLRKELEKSEEKFRQIFESIPDLFFLITEDTTILEYRGKKEDLYISPEEFIGKKMLDILPPDLAESHLKMVKTVVSTKEPQILTYSLPIKKEVRYFEARYLLLSENKIAIFIRDISKQRNLEILTVAQRDLALEMLKTADFSQLMQKSLRVILNATGFDAGGIYIYNEKTDFLDLFYHEGFSPAFVKAVSRYGPGSINYKMVKDGNPVYLSYKELQIPKIEAMDIEGLKSVAIIPILYEKMPLGCVNVASHSKIEISDDSKYIIETLVGQIGQIIYRSKMASALKESEEKFKGIFEAIPDIFFLLSRDTTILDYQGEEGDFYIPLKDSLGKKMSQILPHTLGQKCIDMVEKTIQTKKPQIWEYELPIKGEMRYFEGRFLFFSPNQVALFIRDITKRKVIEDTLRESEEKFRSISEQALMGICILQDNVIKYINRQYANIIGYTPEEMMNWSPFEYVKSIHPEDRKMVVEQARKKQRGDKDVINHYQFRGITKTGKTVWVENYAKTILYGGKPADLIMIIDITERKNAEQKLKESEEKFRTITEQSLMGICIVQDNLIKYVNQAMAEIVEYSIPEIISWSQNDFFKLIHPEHMAYAKQRSTEGQIRDEGLISQDTYKIVTKTGKVKFIDTYAKTIKYQGKKAALVTISDVTAKFEAEQKLKESEEKYRFLIENINDIITEISPDGKILYLSPQVNKMLGYEPEELLNKDIFDYIHVSDIQFLHEIMTNIDLEVYYPLILEFRLKHKYGHYIYAQISATKNFKNDKLSLIGVVRDISEKKVAELELKESEEKYRLITENANDLIAIVNDKYEFEYVNEGTHKGILGYSTKDMIGKSPLDFIHPHDIEKVTYALTEGLKKSTEKGEFRIRHRDGHYLWIQLRGKLFKSSDGEVKGVIIGRDVTDHKLSEERLKESEENFRNISEQSVLGIIIIQDSSIVYANGALSNIHGYSVQEMMSWNIDDLQKLIHPDDYFDIMKDLKEIEFGKTDIREGVVVRIITKSGDIKWIEAYSKIINYQRKSAILTLIHDVTDRKKAEEELLKYRKHLEKMVKEQTAELVMANKKLEQQIIERKQIEKELRESEEKFKSMINISQEIIIRTDLYGNFTFVNTSASEFFQKDVDQIIGANIINFIYSEDREQAKNALKNVIVTGKPILGFPVRMILPSGIRTVKWNGTVIRNNKGRIIELQATGRDITELQEEMIEKNKLAAVGQLAAGVAHELNTPLANINLTAEYILNLMKKQKISYEWHILIDEIMDIKRQVMLCSKIVKELLQFSRKMALNIKKFNLNSILIDLINSPSITARLRENNVRISTIMDEEIDIEVDKALLTQVFQNIINNSIDALNEKDKNPEITIELLKKNNNAEIKIIDNGKGIKEEDLPLVFDPFFSTKPVGKGTGLGLAICRSIVEKHGGKITINSIYGKGTNVKIILPLEQFKNHE